MDAEITCDGDMNCDDWSDEAPSLCGNCTFGSSERFMCRDGSMCIPASSKCNGYVGECVDGSDESTLAGCPHCDQPGAVPCPGFPDNCGVVCDGQPTCPDMWDELQSTCTAHGVACVGEGMYACTDGSRCIGSN